MIRLVLNILLFIILAVFIALNAQNTTAVDLFGYRIESVSTAAVATIAMAIGVLYSFALYLSNYFAKQRAQKTKVQRVKNKMKEEELAGKAKELSDKRTAEIDRPAEPTQPASKSRGAVRSLLKRRKHEPAEEEEPTAE